MSSNSNSNTSNNSETSISVTSNSEISLRRERSDSVGQNEDANKILEVLNEFYKLKSKYETNYYEKYVKPIVKSKNSKREKRVAFSKLPKAECINCKRNVGTLFSVKADPEDYKRIFVAKCDDKDEPCPLNIHFEMADRQNIDKQTASDTDDLKYIKTKIIQDKNDVMFGYVDQKTAITRFEANSEKMSEATEMLGYTINTNLTINNNPKKMELLKHLEIDFGNNMLIPFKNMIKEYEESGYTNTAKMVEAITFYKDEMMPMLSEIQKLKYKTDIIEYLDNVYTLYQRKNSLASSEFNFFTDDKFISFVKGVYEAKRSKTLKNRGSNKNRTRKVKQLILEEEEEEEPVVQEAEAEVEQEQQVEVGNKEYDMIWSTLSQKYKDTLSQDPEWLNKTMNTFIQFEQNRKQGKLRYGEKRPFVHPDNLLLPPKLSEDGSYYDYGHPIYNQILNGPQVPGSKVKMNDVLMSMLPSSPEGSYEQYLSALSNIIGTAIGFTN